MRYRPPRNKWGADFAEDYERNLEDIERDITGVEEIVEGSKTNAEQALTFATEAKGKAESVQAQFNQVVIEGDSSVEAAQARVDAKNVAQPTLKARLDNDYNEVTAQLADNVQRLNILKNRTNGISPTESSYSADPSGILDSTKAFKDAALYASELGGTVLKIPKGDYKVSEQIDLEWNVNLKGDRDFSLVVYHTEGSVLRLKGRHSIENVRFKYPNQTKTGIPTPFATAISSTLNSGYVLLRDIDLGNAYRGIDFTASPTRFILDNIFGFPLYKGIIINDSIDVGYVKNVSFNPNFYGYMPNDENMNFLNWVLDNGTAFDIGRWDWGVMESCFAIAYDTAFKFGAGATRGGSANNIRLDNSAADGCQRSIFAENQESLNINNFVSSSFNFWNSDRFGKTPLKSKYASAINLSGGAGGSGEGRVKINNLNSFRADETVITANVPTTITGSTFYKYAHWFSESDTAVIDAIKLNSGSDGSVITSCDFNGQNKAQNRCIAAIGGNGHIIENNSYNGWKNTDVYTNSSTTGHIIDGHGKGTTTQRPSLGGSGYRDGFPYFDTTLSKMIYKVGSGWRDANGNIV